MSWQYEEFHNNHLYPDREPNERYIEVDDIPAGWTSKHTTVLREAKRKSTKFSEWKKTFLKESPELEK